jgi:hypothetical protein
MRQIAITLIVIATLQGCGTTRSTKLNVQPVQSTAFEFQDQRPEEQRITARYQESGGEITQLGDDTVYPPGPDLFKTWLNNKLLPRLTHKKVVLKEFFVRVLDPAASIDERAFDQATASSGADPISSLLARWLITATESTRSGKIVSVQISGKIGEQEFTGSGEGSFKGRVTEGNINSVIVQALDAAVSDITRLLTAGNSPSELAKQPITK